MRVGVPTDWGFAAGIDADAWPGLDVTRYDAAALNSGDVDLFRVEGLIPLHPGPGVEVLRRFRNLRVISVPGTGVWDLLDLDAVARLGIAVCNVRDYGTDTVAEFTIGLMICLSRGIVAADRLMRGGAWEAGRITGSEIRGRTVGIVGVGNIGARVAELADRLGMDVLGFAPRPSLHRAPGVTYVPLEELLGRSDIVSLHARLDRQTGGLIGVAELGQMRPGAFLINTARGALVDTEALVASLASGRLGGAALDVFDPEPLPADHALRRLPNVILTPHIAASTTAAEAAAHRQCLENLVAFASGSPTNVVVPAPGVTY